ncbi:phytoene dehydrogenase-like protein [Bacillus oleivorans]|uniref:Phytoene dehydrogenase-like protein n=1 Tax=Bacillus oleivorans TaxID=1448271 RepID=A0A285D3D2_9BACI|nr:FAD-dependent oxidoreductase [Bacillus oleivorans]SNX74331.1 phytoene dehydrogenase-like protein [Bacillus oleivorans]
MDKYDVAIVGGGIAGLTAALYAVKAGKKTIVIEKLDRMGGRAMTNKKKGAYFNLGGHALYFGDAYETFRELGLSLKGKKPSIAGYGIWKGKLNTMPLGVKSLFSTPLLSWKGKMELAAWFTKLGNLDTHQYDQLSLREWVEGNLHDPMVRNLFYALLRTASYVVAPDLQAAGPVLNQLKNSLKGVMYLDRGWGTLVDELWEKASDHGVHFLTRNKVVSIEHQNGNVQYVKCKDGTKIEARNIVLATPPAIAYELVPHAEATLLHTWKAQAIEITAACLDVALRRLLKPKQQFVYGIDQTVFLTNQSRAACLSDDGNQVISVIKYQGKETDADKDLLELQKTLDLVQPGWRNELVTQQYLPKITVCHDFMHTKRQVNPGPDVPEIKGLYVAGDWVTHGELLVDAATASAKRAIEHILSQERKERNSKNEHRDIV